MKIFPLYLAIVLVLPVMAWGVSHPTPTAPAPAPDNAYQASQTNDINEVVLANAIGQSHKLFYVSIGYKDPSADFIWRMRKRNAFIEKMSASPQPFVKTRMPGKVAMLAVLPVHWITPTKAEVTVEWPVAGTRYTVVQKDEKWLVTSKEEVWVS